MEIRPDRKLITELWLTLATLTGIILLCAVMLVALVPLSPEASVREVSQITWPVALGVIVLLWLIAPPIVNFCRPFSTNGARSGKRWRSE